MIRSISSQNVKFGRLLILFTLLSDIFAFACCSRFTLSACWFRKNMSCIFHPILQILFQFHHMLHLMTYISIQSLVKGETFRVNLGFLSDPIIPGVWMSLCFETLFYTVYSHLTLVHVGPNKVLAGVFRLKCF